MSSKVRFRTLGCYPLTDAVESHADTLPGIISEMLLARTSDRSSTVDRHTRPLSAPNVPCLRGSPVAKCAKRLVSHFDPEVSVPSGDATTVLGI